MNDNEVINQEIDAMCATPEEEKLMIELERQLEQANKNIVEVVVAPPSNVYQI